MILLLQLALLTGDIVLLLFLANMIRKSILSFYDPSRFDFGTFLKDDHRKYLIKRYLTILRRNLDNSIETLKSTFNGNTIILNVLNSSSFTKKIDKFIERCGTVIDELIDYSESYIVSVDIKRDIACGSNLICAELNKELCKYSDKKSFRVIYDDEQTKTDRNTGAFRIVTIEVFYKQLHIHDDVFGYNIYKVSEMNDSNEYFLLEYNDNIRSYLLHGKYLFQINEKRTNIITGEVDEYIEIQHPKNLLSLIYLKPNEALIEKLITEYFNENSCRIL